MSQHNTFLLQTVKIESPSTVGELVCNTGNRDNYKLGNEYCHFSELVDLDQNVVMLTVRGDVIDPGVEDDPGHGQSDYSVCGAALVTLVTGESRQ